MENTPEKKDNTIKLSKVSFIVLIILLIIFLIAVLFLLYKWQETKAENIVI